MKKLFILVLVAFSILFFQIGNAQVAEPKDGAWIFAFVANAAERPQIKIDGRNPRTSGFDTGWISSPMIVPLGSKRIEAWAGPISADPVNVEVSKQRSPVVVVGNDEKQDPISPSNPPKSVLRIETLGNLASNSSRYQLIYASPKPRLDLQINGQTFVLDKWKPLTLPEMKEKLDIIGRGEQLLVNPIEDGNFVVVLFENKDGKLSHLLVPEAIFSR